ncbi:hypothetical protein PM082_023892 [Marasmius tenuissimus]|nr:hypothetical protein PM082_023892 [Marasmius tenuissimus]
MAHRSAPVTSRDTVQGSVGERAEGSLVSASTTLTDFEAPSIPAEPRRNRAVASSWSKVQAEVEAQDTTSQVETSIPESEAGLSTLNRLNPADAEVPAGSKNVLALSTDFPITKFPAFEKPQATYSLSPNTKPTPSPLSPALASTNTDTDTADISPSLTNGSSAAAALSVFNSPTIATSNITGDGSPSTSSSLQAPPASESTSIATPLLPASSTSITDCSDDVETRKEKEMTLLGLPRHLRVVSISGEQRSFKVMRRLRKIGTKESNPNVELLPAKRSNSLFKVVDLLPQQRQHRPHKRQPAQTPALGQNQTRLRSSRNLRPPPILH